MGEQDESSGFIRKHLVVEVAGAALVAGTAAAVIGIRAIRKQRSARFKDEALMSDISRSDMLSSLESLNNPTLAAETRDLALTVAARIYLATRLSEAQVITLTTLQELTATDDFMLNAVLKDLGEHGLIAQRSSLLDESQIGYFADDPLSWAAGDDDVNSVPGLHEAVASIMIEVHDSAAIDIY